MRTLLFALTAGAVAGIIDIIPMIIKKDEKSSIISAFIHWVVIGLLIPYINWNMPSWLKSFIVAELLVIPILIVVAKNDKTAIVPMLTSSALLGIVLGWVSKFFVC